MDGMVLKIYSYSSWTPIVNAICSKILTDKLLPKKINQQPLQLL